MRAWWASLPMGTKSLLVGGHCALIHGWFVWFAWIKLFGWTWDPRRVLAFFIHDFGYWGKRLMDDEDGERHVEWAAMFLSSLFDPFKMTHGRIKCGLVFPDAFPWGYFCLYHSRFYAKKHRKSVSDLCYADKMAIVLTPWWIYLPMARLTGEIHEYRALAKSPTSEDASRYANSKGTSEREWYAGVQLYLKRWVNEHKDGKVDQWTPTSQS